MPTLEALTGIITAVQAECTELRGAVLSTPEGLVLASYGTLASEIAAAAGTDIAALLAHRLGLLRSPACTDAIVWTPASLWGLGRLPSGHVILAEASPGCSAGHLRLALGRLRRDLGPLLAMARRG